MPREDPAFSSGDVSGGHSNFDLPPGAVAGKPITASRTREQAPQVLQVASEYVAGQIAIRLPAGVCRGNGAVRSVFAKSQAQRVAVTAPQNFCTLKDLR